MVEPEIGRIRRRLRHGHGYEPAAAAAEKKKGDLSDQQVGVPGRWLPRGDSGVQRGCVGG